MYTFLVVESIFYFIFLLVPQVDLPHYFSVGLILYLAASDAYVFLKVSFIYLRETEREKAGMPEQGEEQRRRERYKL